MSYAIIIPKEKFVKKSVNVRDYYLEKNKLWSVNGGDMILHYSQGNDSFLKEIGLSTVMEKPNYLKYSDDEYLEIFKYYYQKGELLTVKFFEDFDDVDVNEFHNRIRFNVKKNDLETRDMGEYYRFITEEITGSPWNFTIIKGKERINLYQNSVVYVSGTKGKEEETAFTVYQEIFDLLNKPLSYDEITIEEKEKAQHPLKNAHKVVSTLFEVAGDGVVENLGINEKEYGEIREALLAYTKELESKMVYK